MDNDKIDQHSDEIEVESEEKERGKKIEIDEDRLPSRAMAIHEHIRQDGEKELERDAMALLWSAIAAGLSMGASLLAKGIFHVELEGVPGSFLLENLGYTFGFIIVIMARQQLFTENTVTAVLPVMQKPTMSNVGLLMRLWGVVLLGNILGTGIAAWAFEYMPIFNEENSRCICQNRHGCDEEHTQRDVCQRAHFRLADRHYGMDVSCSGCGKDCGDYIDDLDYCPG
ncbi:transporter protein [Escherichia coli]|nr:transporter protein [Escherichia coli]